MKIKSNLHAGYTDYNDCQQDVEYWKMEAQAMDQYSKTGAWPSDLPYPTVPTTPTSPPTYPPTYPTTGGGYVNGVYYPDYSGYCSGTTPPPPPTTGGGYVNGVYYPDYSGYC